MKKFLTGGLTREVYNSIIPPQRVRVKKYKNKSVEKL